METLELTAQQWFDAAWARAKNPVQSKIGNTCTYNQDFNGGCFIGCAAPDNKLANLVGAAWILCQSQKIAVTGLTTGESTDFLQRLQRIHDHTPPKTWKDNLIGFATSYKLETPNEN